MGHRHLLGSSQMYENDHDQNWNHMQTEQSYGHLGRASSSESGSFFYPIESMLADGIHFSPHWNPLPRQSHGGEIQPYSSDNSAPSGSAHDPFQQHPPSGTFPNASNNYALHASSSSRQTFQGIEPGFADLTMGSGTHKRKSSGTPLERGGSSRYYGAGSSSEMALPEKPGLDTQNMWDSLPMNSGYNRGNGISIRADGSLRNVRSRITHDLETNLARTHLSNNPVHNSYPTNPVDHPTGLELSGPPSAGLTGEWTNFGASPQRNVPISDNSSYNPEPSRFLLGSSANTEESYRDFISNSLNAPQSYSSASAQSARGVRSNFSHRAGPSFRASSSGARLRLGNPSPIDDVAAESHARQARPSSINNWRNGDRSSRSRILHERYRVLSDEASLHERIASEAFMLVDRSAIYGSRNLLDQHREMRLDVDSMSYEELLALGERIGVVSTGVSVDLMPKCVTETIYCSSDQAQEEGSCVICLEEYKNMDDVGSLKVCGHDYHVECIKKWLEMKNSCPICKTPVLPETVKGE